MISISSYRPLQLQLIHRISYSHRSISPPSYSFRRRSRLGFRRRAAAMMSGSGDGYGSELLRKPVTAPEEDLYGESENDVDDEEDLGFVDWEQKILEDTVPLVSFARMILHSGRYEVGDRLSFEHEKIVLERLLPYHPEGDKKIGCGVNYITIGYHPDFGRSRCLFIVREDGEYVDFSYWKCIKGLIRKNYPHYADDFILKHFQRRKDD